MTQATVNPATVASYTADDIKRQLAAGRTVQQVADRTGWPRQRVTAIINGVRGWMLDPGSDKVYELSARNKQVQPRLPADVDPDAIATTTWDGRPDARPEVTVDPEPADQPVKQDLPPAADTFDPLMPPPAVLAQLARTLGMLATLNDPTVTKEITRARDALTKLEEALTIGERRRQAEAEIEAAKAALAAAQDKLRRLKTGKAPAAITPASPEVTPREIRAWAAEEGIECAPNGKIPASVREQYDAAHGKD